MLCLKAGQLGELEIRLLTVYADIFSRMLRNYTELQQCPRQEKKTTSVSEISRTTPEKCYFPTVQWSDRPHLAQMTNFVPPPFNAIMLISVYGEIQITVCLKKTVSLSYTVGSTAAVME